MRISKHISYNEAVFSATAIRNKIDNTPDSDTIDRMKLVAEKCFEPLRIWYKKAIKVNSFFRSWTLNTLVGGSKTSQHPLGEAIDISAGTRAENKKLFDWCKANLEFDQLIWEYGNSVGPDWIHISYRKNGNRKQIKYIK